jgi:hypothetical protein
MRPPGTAQRANTNMPALADEVASVGMWKREAEAPLGLEKSSERWPGPNDLQNDLHLEHALRGCARSKEQRVTGRGHFVGSGEVVGEHAC